VRRSKLPSSGRRGRLRRAARAMAWLEGTGGEFLVGDVFLRLRHRNTSSGKRMVQPRLTSNRRVVTVCASIATSGTVASADHG
jgi:hypothetical protein